MAAVDGPREDQNVKAALKGGRPPNDIMLCCCPRCHGYGYYNQGSHFTCPWCEWSASGARLDRLIDDGEMISLEDYDDMQYDPGVP